VETATNHLSPRGACHPHYSRTLTTQAQHDTGMKNSKNTPPPSRHVVVRQQSAHKRQQNAQQL